MNKIEFQRIAMFNMREPFGRELIQDIMDFTNQSYDIVSDKILTGVGIVYDEWIKTNPKTVAEERLFYKTTKNYVYDLAVWHLSTRRPYDLKLIEQLKELKKTKGRKLNILDFGCGIAQNGYMIAKEGIGNVTIADLDSYTLSFATERFNKHKLPVTVWKIDTDSAPTNKFDVILAFDVFEHLDEQTYKDTIQMLIPLKSKDCIVLTQVSYGTLNDTHPMHYENSSERIILLDKFMHGENENE